MISLVDLYTNEQKPKSVIQTASKENHTRWFIDNLTLERRIGAGAHSKVYSAHSTDKSECAIKIIDDLTQSEAVDYLKKLVPASALSGSLAHSINTVHIHRFENRLTWKGNSKVFQIVIIMEKLMNSLWELHKEKVKTGTPWTEDQLVKLLVSVCNSLSEASKRDLPHYDLHERNIFFDETTSLFLVGDLGVPKILKHRKNNVSYESDYLAPEAKGVQGIKDEIDFYKADVYSLGLILVKLLSLKENFPIQDRTKVEALLKEKKGDYPFIVQILEEHMLVLDPLKREDARNVKYFILSINFDLAFGTTNAKDVLLKKRVLPALNLDIKNDLNEAFDIARTYEFFELYSKANEDYLKILASAKKQDATSKEIAQIVVLCYERIGIVYLELKDYKNSLETFQELYNFINTGNIQYLIGESHPLFIQVHHYLSVANYHLGNIPESMSQLKHATDAGLSKSNDSELNGKIRELYMGIMKFIQNDYNKSLNSMLNVADYLTNISEKDNPETVDSLLMIAEYYRKLNGDKQALDIYMRAKKMILNLYGDKSTEYMNIMKEISATQKNMNELKSAFNIQLDILEKVRQNGSKNAFIDALMDLADILSKQGKSSEAIFSAEMAFKVSNKVYWLKHEKTIQVYNFLMKLIGESSNSESYSHYENLRSIMVSEDAIRMKVKAKAEYKSS